MAEPTSGLSFTELIRRTANKAGVAYFGSSGDQSALIPVDPYNLGLCKDIVRDAFRMFVSDCPKRGWKWQKRLMSVTLTATRITGTVDTIPAANKIADATLAATYNADDDLNDYYAYILTGTGIGSFAQVTDYDYQSGDCSSWIDNGDNTYQFTSVLHGLFSTDVVTIADASGDFNGDYTVTAVDINTLKITPTKNSVAIGPGATVSGITGDWKNGVVTVDDWLDQYGNAGGEDPIAGDTFAITGVETVGGDISRYPLPESFGGEVAGKIDYAASTAHATLIEWRGEAFIRAGRVPTVTTGYPHYACIRPLEPAITDIEDGSTKRRFEFILDPQPSAADVLEFPYLAHFDNLDVETGTGDSGGNTDLTDGSRSEGNDYFLGWRCDVISGTGKGSWAIVTGYTGSTGAFGVADWLKANGDPGGTNPGASSAYTVQPVNNFHPAGFRFDEFILAACYAKLAMEDEEVDPALEQRYIKKALPGAYQADARLAPRKLGSMNETRHRYERTWLNRTTEHDV